MLLNRNIFIKIFSLLLIAWGLSSCVNEDLGDCENGSDRNNTLKDPFPHVTFHVKSIENGVRSTEVKEQIASLRIIMLNNGKIELNKLISFSLTDPNKAPTEGVPASDFNQIITTRTVPGNKSFFFIANEASIGEVKFSANDKIPSDLTDKDIITFADVMTYYSGFAEGVIPGFPNEDGEFDAGFPDKTPGEFAAVMNSLYFEPSYTPDSDGNVYLAYTSYYDNDGNGYEIFEDTSKNKYNEEGHITFQDMYLVPVATKFTFKIVNTRSSTIDIDYAYVKSLHKSNYLMARLSEKEQQKKFLDDKEKPAYYWIDWLQKVAELSNDNFSANANSSFNTLYGWISEYEVPEPEVKIEDYYFTLAKNKDDVEWKVDGSDDGEGITKEFGPIYVPESKNMLEETIYDPNNESNPKEDEEEDTDPDLNPDEELESQSDEGDESGEVKPKDDNEGDSEKKEDEGMVTRTVEKYELKIKFREEQADFTTTNTSEYKVFEAEISNLKSLFRNTHIYITLTLRAGGVHIYAETVAWNRKVFYGYVKDENEIKK